MSNPIQPLSSLIL